MAQRGLSLKTITATTQGKTYTIALVTFFIVILMFFLAIRPAFLSVTDQNAKNEEKRAYLLELTDRENALKQLARQEADNSFKIDVLNQIMPDKRNDEFVVANLSAISDRYNCSLQNVIFQTETLPKVEAAAVYANLFEVPFQITLRCEPQNLQLVIDHLEHFPLPIIMTSITYTNKEAELEEEAQTGLYTMNILANYYFWKFE